jgi:hypothetical protein
MQHCQLKQLPLPAFLLQLALLQPMLLQHDAE